MFVAAALLLPLHCFGTTLFFVGSSGGTYDYDLIADQDTTFGTGPGILLIDLAGVTGASVLTSSPNNLKACFPTANFTSTSVTLFTSGGCDFPSGTGPVSYGTLEIVSSFTTPGTVSYAIDSSNLGVLDGTIQGPVAPEPSFAWLTLAAMCVGFGFRKYKSL
jgi:hypothetical protein